MKSAIEGQGQQDEVPRHFPNAHWSAQTPNCLPIRSRQTEKKGRKLGGREGERKSPTAKKPMSRSKSQIGSLPGSESSVIAHVNHVQTGYRRPSGLQHEIHHS